MTPSCIKRYQNKIILKGVNRKMKLSHGFILVMVLLLWIMPCSAGNITYYDPKGNIVTKERYYEICRKSKNTSSEPEFVSKDYVKSIKLGDQLQKFLRIYCRTFQDKNLSKFSDFFTDDAIEKGKSFNSLLPTYRKNFKIIDSIGYQIELKKYSCQVDSGTLEIQGKFYLKWFSKGADWKKNYGSISMSLVEHNNSYRIKRLDYNIEI